jgi:hypothetical protein
MDAGATKESRESILKDFEEYLSLGRVVINRDWSAARLVDVRFTPKADMCGATMDVR